MNRQLVMDAVLTRPGGWSLRTRLNVAPGEVVALTGDNGAGKTTVLLTLCGLHAVRSGEVHCGDVLWDSPTKRRFVPPHRRRVGAAFQEPRLLPHLTAQDNVAFPLRPRFARGSARQRADQMLTRWGVLECARKRPVQLSGGQQAKVGLARALMGEPAVIVLDEPFAEVDRTHRAELRTMLAGLLAAADVPVVLSTHDPDDIAQLAHRTLNLSGGEMSPIGQRSTPRSRES